MLKIDGWREPAREMMMVTVWGPGVAHPSGPLPAVVLRLLVTAGLTLVAWLLATAFGSSSTAEAAVSGPDSDPVCTTGGVTMSESDQRTEERGKEFLNTPVLALSNGTGTNSTEIADTKVGACEPDTTDHGVEPERPEADESASQSNPSAELGVSPDAVEPRHQTRPKPESHPATSIPAESRDEVEPVQQQQPDTSPLGAVTRNVENAVYTVTAPIDEIVNSTVNRVTGTITHTINNTVQSVTEIADFPHGTGLDNLSGVGALLPDLPPLPVPPSPIAAPAPSPVDAFGNSESDKTAELRSDTRPEPAVPHVAQTPFTAFGSPVLAAVRASDQHAADHQNGPVGGPDGTGQRSPLPAAPVTFNPSMSNIAVHQDNTTGSSGEQGISNEMPPLAQLRMLGTNRHHDVVAVGRDAALPTTSPD